MDLIFEEYVYYQVIALVNAYEIIILTCFSCW
jgi:hypothetical protein